MIWRGSAGGGACSPCGELASQVTAEDGLLADAGGERQKEKERALQRPLGKKTVEKPLRCRTHDAGEKLAQAREDEVSRNQVSDGEAEVAQDGAPVGRDAPSQGAERSAAPAAAEGDESDDEPLEGDGDRVAGNAVAGVDGAPHHGERGHGEQKQKDAGGVPGGRNGLRGGSWIKRVRDCGGCVTHCVFLSTSQYLSARGGKVTTEAKVFSEPGLNAGADLLRTEQSLDSWISRS